MKYPERNASIVSIAVIVNYWCDGSGAVIATTARYKKTSSNDNGISSTVNDLVGDSYGFLPVIYFFTRNIVADFVTIDGASCVAGSCSYDCSVMYLERFIVSDIFIF